MNRICVSSTYTCTCCSTPFAYVDHYYHVKEITWWSGKIVKGEGEGRGQKSRFLCLYVRWDDMGQFFSLTFLSNIYQK